MAEIDQFLKFMINAGASDFFLSSGAKPMVRLHGNMVAFSNKDILERDEIKRLLDEIMPDRNKKEFAEKHDTDFAYALEGIGRFRTNIFLDQNGIGSVMRQIPSKIPTFEELNLPAGLKNLCFLNKGIVLVTGPTGSGKSTTLAAMVDFINDKRKDHIITIEDPVEFVHKNKNCLVNQREVHRHTMSFKNALRAALREAPDVVLVGEMRDLETTEIAIETAETGHLVFGTLHTSTAASTVDRIIDQFSADRQPQIRTMLAASLKGVIAQTLCKRKGGKGRIAALEILITTPAISNNIREGKTYQIPTAIQTGRKLGMQMLNDDLLRLVKEGIVEAKEAYLKSVEKEDLLSQMKVAGFQVTNLAE